MALSSTEIKSLYLTSPDTISHEIGRLFRGFGYNHVTDEMVKAELKAQIEDGAEPCNLNYGLWIKNYLETGIDLT